MTQMTWLHLKVLYTCLMTIYKIEIRGSEVHDGCHQLDTKSISAKLAIHLKVL